MRILLMKKLLTLEQVVQYAKEKHGQDRYEYIGMISGKQGEGRKLIYACTVCNTFNIQPIRSHLSGHGCNHCGHQKVLFDEFVKKANLKHGNQFEYIRIIRAADGTRDKPRIIYKCPRCDQTLNQRCSNHLDGYVGKHDCVV